MGIETATLRLRYALIYLLPDIKSNERTEYSYIGLAVFFFQEKVLKFVH